MNKFPDPNPPPGGTTLVPGSVRISNGVEEPNTPRPSAPSTPELPHHLATQSPISNLPAPKRRRPRATRPEGGQPGNTNALKHGFYSARAYRQSFDPTNTSSTKHEPLPTLDTTSLKSEIKMLRAITARVAALFDDAELTPERGLALLNTFSAATTRVGTLVRTEKLLNGASDYWGDMIHQVLEEIMVEHGFTDTP